MKKVLLTLALALFAATAGAQGLSRVTEELARPDFTSGARIEVKVESDAAAAVRNADFGSARGSGVMAYGVRLFSDLSQNARGNAEAVRAQFAELYPGIDVKVPYESPYFWVTAGPFVDRTEAVALCGRAAAQFPKAFVALQEVSLADIIARERTEPPTETVME